MTIKAKSLRKHQLAMKLAQSEAKEFGKTWEEMLSSRDALMKLSRAHLENLYVCRFIDQEKLCDHAGFVFRGECNQCGAHGLEPESEIYESENPR